MNISNLIIDFDSTIIKKESLEVLAKNALKRSKDKEKIINKIQTITEQGMNGEISFETSLNQRMELLCPTKDVIRNTVKSLKTAMSHSFKEHISELQKMYRVFIISGGFYEIIIPLLEKYVPSEKIFANRFIWKDSKWQGVDTELPLAKNQGKVKTVKNLKLQGKTLVVGDGYTDYEIKKEGYADYFVYYGEHVRREKVVSLADKVIVSFSEL